MHDLKDVAAILDVFQKHGHNEVSSRTLWFNARPDTVDQIDTARTYTGGTSEEYLGDLGWQKRGLKMDTKLYPNVVSNTTSSHPSIHILPRAISCLRAPSRPSDVVE